MFNKPGVFGRNEPVTRRDAQPASGGVTGNVSGTTTQPSEKSAASIKSNSASSGSSTFGTTSSTLDSPSASVTSGAADVKDTPATTGTSVAKPAAVSDRVSEARLIVGPDVKLKGAEILDCDTLVVEGRVEATMDSRVIRIAENGAFSGKVSIDIAEIHGTFDGELTARSQLIIHSTGRVSGTIRFGTLVVDEGGELCGEINVLTDKTSSATSAGRSSGESSTASGSSFS